jgi:hypothetical protein
LRVKWNAPSCEINPTDDHRENYQKSIVGDDDSEEEIGDDIFGCCDAIDVNFAGFEGLNVCLVS